MKVGAFRDQKNISQTKVLAKISEFARCPKMLQRLVELDLEKITEGTSCYTVHPSIKKNNNLYRTSVADTPVCCLQTLDVKLLHPFML